MYNILEEEAEKCLFRLTSFTELLFERFLTGTREPASFVKIPETEKICQKNQLTTPYFWQVFSLISLCILAGVFFKLRGFWKFQEKIQLFCGKNIPPSIISGFSGVSTGCEEFFQKLLPQLKDFSAALPHSCRKTKRNSWLVKKCLRKHRKGTTENWENDDMESKGAL